MPRVTGEMKVADVIRRWPSTVDVFLDRGCPDMRRGFFSFMARMHRLDLQALLRDLDDAAARDGG